MKKLNELGGLRAFRVDTIKFGPNPYDTQSDNAGVYINLPENFLPIALTGKIGALLIPENGSSTKSTTQTISFCYNFQRSNDRTSFDQAIWTGWGATVGESGYTTPELYFAGDDTVSSILSEGFEEVYEDEIDHTIIAKPDIPLYVIGVTTSLNEEN